MEEAHQIYLQYFIMMDKDKFTLQTIRQDLIDNNLQAKAIIQVNALLDRQRCRD